MWVDWSVDRFPCHPALPSAAIYPRSTIVTRTPRPYSCTGGVPVCLRGSSARCCSCSRAHDDIEVKTIPRTDVFERTGSFTVRCSLAATLCNAHQNRKYVPTARTSCLSRPPRRDRVVVKGTPFGLHRLGPHGQWAEPGAGNQPRARWGRETD